MMQHLAATHLAAHARASRFEIMSLAWDSEPPAVETALPAGTVLCCSYTLALRAGGGGQSGADSGWEAVALEQQPPLITSECGPPAEWFKLPLGAGVLHPEVEAAPAAECRSPGGTLGRRFKTRPCRHHLRRHLRHHPYHQPHRTITER